MRGGPRREERPRAPHAASPARGSAVLSGLGGPGSGSFPGAAVRRGQGLLVPSVSSTSSPLGAMALPFDTPEFLGWFDGPLSNAVPALRSMEQGDLVSAGPASGLIPVQAVPFLGLTQVFVVLLRNSDKAGDCYGGFYLKC